MTSSPAEPTCARCGHLRGYHVGDAEHPTRCFGDHPAEGCSCLAFEEQRPSAIRDSSAVAKGEVLPPDVEWNGDYAKHGDYQLSAYWCLGGAKWGVSFRDEDCFAQGKVPWSHGALEEARLAALLAMHSHQRWRAKTPES